MILVDNRLFVDNFYNMFILGSQWCQTCKMHKKYIQVRSYLAQISRKSQCVNKILKNVSYINAIMKIYTIIIIKNCYL